MINSTSTTEVSEKHSEYVVDLLPSKIISGLSDV